MDVFTTLMMSSVVQDAPQPGTRIQPRRAKIETVRRGSDAGLKEANIWDSGSEDSCCSGEEEVGAVGKKPQPVQMESNELTNYKDKLYRGMPGNVRRALDKAMAKQKHTDFFYKLERLNDQIRIFRSVFYDRVPKNEAHFQRRK